MLFIIGCDMNILEVFWYLLFWINFKIVLLLGEFLFRWIDFDVLLVVIYGIGVLMFCCLWFMELLNLVFDGSVYG